MTDVPHLDARPENADWLHRHPEITIILNARERRALAKALRELRARSEVHWLSDAEMDELIGVLEDGLTAR
jgi:hypothetical protein